MREEVKTFVTNLINVILALEIRAFFEKGGGNNDLAFTILKIVFLTLFIFGMVNMEDVTRVIIHKTDAIARENETNGVLSLRKLLKPVNLTK
jgi:hypothetical protein